MENTQSKNRNKNEDQCADCPLAVVTGASSGIGFELARQFAQNGYDLIVAAEDADIVRAADELRALGHDVEAVRVDLARYEGVEELYRRIQSCGKPVDALALNAGVGVGGDFAGNELKDELNLIRLNITSPVHLAKRVVKDMVARKQGKILFTSSIASVLPAPFLAVYGGSKAFIQSFAQALRNELKDTGITVTSLMPGATDTEFFERADMEDTRVGMRGKDDPAVVAKQGFDALMRGDDHVVAGSIKYKLQALAAKVLPETAKAALHRIETEPTEPKDESKKKGAA